MNIFVYGTLIFKEIWNKIIKNNYDFSHGHILGFSRRKVISELYPVIVKIPLKIKLDGIIYYNISDEDISRLDFYEGNEYYREQVTCYDQARNKVLCNTYLFKNKFTHLISEEEWNINDFKINYLDKYIRSIP